MDGSLKDINLDIPPRRVRSARDLCHMVRPNA